LGVKEHTFVEEYNLALPVFLKNVVAGALWKSGGELFGMDSELVEKRLLHMMGTKEMYLAPLRAFRSRRLYANIDNDFVVPLGTAAFVPKVEVARLRLSTQNRYGINAMVDAYDTESAFRDGVLKDEDRFNMDMIQGLNSMSWQKLLVRFPGFWPDAHNKICAMTKYTPFIDELLGFPQGRFVMDDAANWFDSS
jgi:hypothetical protein